MSDKAPTVIAEVRGFSYLDLSGKAHYANLGPGVPVIISREPTNQADPNAVMVNTSCCGVMIGYVGKEDAAILAKWMDKGWQYTANVKNTASVVDGYVGPICAQNMVIRCVPIGPLSAKKTEKKVKELEDA